MNDAVSTPTVQVPSTTPAASTVQPAAPLAAAPERSIPDALGLADKAASIRRSEKQLADQRKAHAQELAALAEYRKLDEEAKANPLVALSRYGHSIEAAQAAHLEAAKAGQPATQAQIEARKAQEEVASLRAQIEERDLAAQVDRFRTEIRGKVDAAAKDADLLRVYRARDGSYDGVDFVCDVIRAHYAETGEELPVADAIAAAEKTLEDEWLPNLTKSEKIAAKLAATTKDTKGSPAVQANGAKAPEGGPPTLRAQDLAEPSSGAPKGDPRDFDERIRRAAERLQTVQSS